MAVDRRARRPVDRAEKPRTSPEKRRLLIERALKVGGRASDLAPALSRSAIDPCDGGPRWSVGGESSVRPNKKGIDSNYAPFMLAVRLHDSIQEESFHYLVFDL